MKLVDIISEARSNLMMIAPTISFLGCRRDAGEGRDYRLIHTGKHQDARMSLDFYTQLGKPESLVNLEVGSGSQAEQTGAIMTHTSICCRNGGAISQR